MVCQGLTLTERYSYRITDFFVFVQSKRLWSEMTFNSWFANLFIGSLEPVHPGPCCEMMHDGTRGSLIEKNTLVTVKTILTLVNLAPPGDWEGN